MSDELIARLRNPKWAANIGDQLEVWCRAMDEAADRIEALEALIERLRKYAACLPACQSVDESLGNPNPGGPCTCGLTALLTELENPDG